MADDRRTAKNVAAQHHDEMAAEHDKEGHKLDEEHRSNVIPAHEQKTNRLHNEQTRRG